MSNYEITIQVDMRETEQEVTQGAQHSTDGRFRIVISREAGQSIDHGEQALFAANYPAMREALSRHFSEVSQQAAEGYRPGILKKPHALSGRWRNRAFSLCNLQQSECR